MMFEQILIRGNLENFIVFNQRKVYESNFKNGVLIYIYFILCLMGVWGLILWLFLIFRI